MMRNGYSNGGLLRVSRCSVFVMNLLYRRYTGVLVYRFSPSNLTIIGSDNGLAPGQRQAIIWINARILLIRPLGTNFNERWIEILTFSFMKMRLKV